ncbi:hypothetical protein V8C34DRAFT_283981 [Trichoderma compactum]
MKSGLKSCRRGFNDLMAKRTVMSLRRCFLSARRWVSQGKGSGRAGLLLAMRMVLSRLRLWLLLLRVCFGGGIGAMMCRIGGRGVRTLCMWETLSCCFYVCLYVYVVRLCVCRTSNGASAVWLTERRGDGDVCIPKGEEEEMKREERENGKLGLIRGVFLQSWMSIRQGRPPYY